MIPNGTQTRHEKYVPVAAHMSSCRLSHAPSFAHGTPAPSPFRTQERRAAVQKKTQLSQAIGLRVTDPVALGEPTPFPGQSVRHKPSIIQNH